MDLLCHQFPAPVFNLVSLEVAGLPELPHLSHDVINSVLVGLNVILQQLEHTEKGKPLKLTDVKSVVEEESYT